MLVKIIWRWPLKSEWTDLRQEVILYGTCEREDRGETTRRSKSCPSRWWNEELPEWHYKRKLPANTNTDKSRVEAASSTKTGNHECTVARTLEGMLHRVKLARPLPDDGNRPGVPQKRVGYANCFMRHAVVNQSIFVDEFWYNIRTARSHGRATLGERAYLQVCGQRGRNVTKALAISPTNGLVFHLAFFGGMTGQRFNDFLTQVRLYLDPKEHVIFIYVLSPSPNQASIWILGCITWSRLLGTEKDNHHEVEWNGLGRRPRAGLIHKVIK